MAAAAHATLFRNSTKPFAPAAPTSTAAAPAKEEKHGMLANRHPKDQDIPREQGGINLAHNWGKRGVVPHTKMNQMDHPQRKLITNEIRPMAEVNKKIHLKNVKGQFRHRGQQRLVAADFTSARILVTRHSWHLKVTRRQSYNASSLMPCTACSLSNPLPLHGRPGITETSELFSDGRYRQCHLAHGTA